MVFWSLQILFNGVLFVALFVMARRLRHQEQLIRTLQSRSDFESLQPALPAPVLNTPLGSPTSTLSERQTPESRSNGSAPLDAYDKADFLISRGTPLREVARQTGLSLAELQLIGKMSQKSQ